MPITTAVIATVTGDLVLDQAKGAIADFIKKEAIGRWSEHRAKKFLDAFVDEVIKEQDVKTTSADLNDMLQSIAKSENQTSALFDAYRRVALSASKDIGPMVIGLLTAKIVSGDRDASEIEEMVFEGAEVLKDKDFLDFQSWMTHVHADQDYSTALSQNTKYGKEPSAIAFMAKGEKSDPTYLMPVSPGASKTLTTASYQAQVRQFGDQETPLNIFRDIGPFALKLRNVGLLQEEERPRGHHRNPSGTNYFILLNPACEELYDLSSRAAQAAKPRSR
ncbi:hypothetical protein [Burkholderia gladioli]|uniref:hypothetical protein n=1 Tax=Burkholderia gladioli TaxID=28095 RepID=UPI00163E1F1E|nr:hypothetical protein [Burkholderia gladioli]